MRITLLIALAVLLGTGAVRAGTMDCRPADAMEITADGRCLESGISVGTPGVGGELVACLKDDRLHAECGGGGELARVHAFSEWLSQLKDFENRCAQSGGQFSYADAGFREPEDDSYCGEAAALIGSSTLEETTCNYHSTCPSTKVVCDHPCKIPLAQRF